MRGGLLALLIAALLALAGDRPPETRAAPPYDFSAPESAIQAQVDSGTFPGASLLLFKDGAPIYEHHFGTFGPSTAAPIASSTKWLSGAVIMSLVDDGTLSLDDTVSEYLPAWTGQIGTITVRQLMSHTSGLVDEHACVGDGSVTIAQCVEMIRMAGLVAPPGSQFFYGGASMQVAGHVAEVASGQPWATLFNERVRYPSGMPSTFYWPPLNPRIGGGVVSTLSDYAHFLEMSLAGGQFGSEQVLTPGAIATMEQDQTGGAPIAYTPHPDSRRYGIGLWRDIVSGGGQAVQVSSQGLFGMSPWLDRERRYFGVFFVQDQLTDVYLLVANVQSQVRAVIDAYDTDGDGTGDGADTNDDNDGQLDVSDGCAARFTHWPTPIGDVDCDGFTFASESWLETDAGSACATTPDANDETDDRWPADFTDNQIINTLDLTVYASTLNTTTGNPNYVARADLNGNAVINTLDLVPYATMLNRSCAAMP